MKAILLIFKNIKDLFPYFLIIALYFLFISIEARKDQKINSNIENEIELLDKGTNIQDKQLRIKIPVIPYKK